MEYVDPSEKSIFLAFNSSIARELQSKVPPHVDARTLNSAGWRICRQVWPEIRLDAKKTTKIAKALRPGLSWGDLSSIQRAVGLMKAHGSYIEGDDHETFLRDLEMSTMARSTTYEVYLASMRETLVADFDDQIWLPVIHGCAAPTYDRIFVDEAQDLSPCQRDFVRMILQVGMEDPISRKSVSEDGQAVFVGDRSQAIYAFRGADSNSMGEISAEFRCLELPLSVTYRCPTAVVGEAKKWTMEDIAARDGAPEGVVRRGEPEPEPGDMVVCRMNAPLVGLCYKLIQSRINAFILGRDVAGGLKSLAKKMRRTDTESLRDRLDEWESAEIKKARARDASAGYIMSISDRAKCLRVLSMEVDTTAELISLIDEVFSPGDPDAPRVTLCTVHKSKGLEADRVWILDEHLMPHPAAKGPEAIAQERNLRYVAITRAKKELVYA